MCVEAMDSHELRLWIHVFANGLGYEFIVALGLKLWIDVSHIGRKMDSCVAEGSS